MSNFSGTGQHPGVFAEFYFPKRVAYQDEIVKALKEGVNEQVVKEYLLGCARQLLTELADYPSVLDPRRYEGRRTENLNAADVKKRIEMFKNPFFGWSTYSVEGAFLNTRTGELQDELTQIVRVIHRFDSELASFKRKEYERIVQSITSWLLLNYYHRIASPPYGDTHIQQFNQRASLFFGTGNRLHQGKLRGSRHRNPEVVRGLRTVHLRLPRQALLDAGRQSGNARG